MDQKLAIEARAFLVSSEEREKQKKFNRVFVSLNSIEKPFAVKFKIKTMGNRISTVEFVEKVSRWLDIAADQNFVYLDDLGNVIHLSANPMPTLKKVGAFSSEGLWVNPDVLKTPLSEKASQHKALRNANIPYVIAIFLEPTHLSAEEVAEAWIGKLTVVYNPETDQVVEEKYDRSGIHFFGNEVRHKSVTGTLVFRSGDDQEKKSRYLKCWYVQNPYANVSIDPNLFPAQSRFVIVDQKENRYKMGWVK
jgi:hypothetical protein